MDSNEKIKEKQTDIINEADQSAWHKKDEAEKKLLVEREQFVNEHSPPYPREQMYETWDFQIKTEHRKLCEQYEADAYNNAIAALANMEKLVVDDKIVENTIENRKAAIEEYKYEHQVDVTSCVKCGHTIFVHPSVPKEERVCAHCTPGYFTTTADKDAIAMSTGKKTYRRR